MSTSTADQTELVPPVVPNLQPPTTPNSPKKRKPRATLTPQHMSTLIASYRMHYGSYVQSRESVTQLVPSSVWKKVYNDFVGLYPEAAAFDHEHLKTRVRNMLKDMDERGVNNQNNSINDLVQQNEQILKRLKMTGASPLMQQILWRNHNAEISSQQKPMNAVTVQAPPAEKSPETPASSTTPSQTTAAITPSSSEPAASGDTQTMQPAVPTSQTVSTQPSQTTLTESDCNDVAGHRNGAGQDPKPQPETIAARPAPMTSQSQLGKKALMQTQTQALCKMSTDFNKACAGIMEFLEIHKAKAKQEETKCMLANFEKACNMGVITFEEMKSKARKLLDMQ